MKTKTINPLNIRIGRIFLSWAFMMAAFMISAKAASETAVAKQNPSLSLYHAKLGTGNHLIKATLSVRTEDGRKVLAGKRILFAGGTDLSVLFGESKTNDQGIATFTVLKEKLPAVDTSGTLTLGAKFEGDSLYESTEDQVATKDLIIDLFSEEGDSVKSVTAKAYTLGAAGEKIPLTGTDIFFYVPRMFSYLKVGEGTLDSTGSASIEFPVGIPGDTLGNLTVIARVEDHDLYGNSEGQTVVKWGQPTQTFVKSSYRALWSQVAPTWMVITLIILLAGVWGHYTYAVIKLIQIKKEAQKLHEQ